MNTLSKSMGLDVSLSSNARRGASETKVQSSPTAVTTDFTKKLDELFEAEAHASLHVIYGCDPQIVRPSEHHLVVKKVLFNLLVC